MTNDAGQVVEQYLYDAYGTPCVFNAAGAYLGQSSPQDNRYLFHGASAYEWLPTPALYYCRHRMYLPVHGRWLQPDPSGFAGGDVNLYRYCANDPVDASDPSGLIDEDDQVAQNAGYGDNPCDAVTNVQPSNYTPTGSHIPDVSFDDGPYRMLESSITGLETIGPSSAIQTAMASGTYECTDRYLNTYARATAVDGPTPPVPKATAGIIGFGGAVDWPSWSNNDFKLGVLAADPNALFFNYDDTQGAAQYLADMSNLGAPSLALYGYSLGGAAAIQVTNELAQVGISVDLETIDPVAIFGQSFSVPAGSSSLNYYEQNGGLIGLVPGFFGQFGGTRVGNAQNQPPLATIHQNMPYRVFQP